MNEGSEFSDFIMSIPASMAFNNFSLDDCKRVIFFRKAGRKRKAGAMLTARSKFSKQSLAFSMTWEWYFGNFCSKFLPNRMLITTFALAKVTDHLGLIGRPSSFNNFSCIVS